MSALAIEESFLSDAVGPKAFPLIIAAILGIGGGAVQQPELLAYGAAADWASASSAAH